MLQRLPAAEDATRLQQVREWAAEKLAGPDFEGRYARRLAEAVEVEVLRARESLATNSTLNNISTPIGANLGITVSQPGDVLQLAKDSQTEPGGPLRLMRRLHDLQVASWIWWHTEPIVGNILATWTALVIGNGVEVSIEDDLRRFDGSNAAEAWAEFDQRNQYTGDGGMVWDAAFNTFLFGEWFHWFLRPEDGPWPTRVVGLDPISRGGIREIRTARDDFQEPLAYLRRGMFEQDAIPADEINHWKLAIGGNQVRGRPIVERAYDDIFRLQQTRLSTWMLQEFRMRIMVLRYVREKKEAKPLPANFPMPNPLTIQEVPPGAKIEEPDLQKTVIGSSGDNSPDFLLTSAIAQAVFLPYHVVAQQFREANLASLIAAEGPTAKMAELFRSRLENAIRADVRQVVGERQPTGDPLPISVAITPVIIRDEFKERESWLALREAGEISRETLHEKIGLEPEQEQERLDRERTDERDRMESENPFGITEAAREDFEPFLEEVTEHYEAAGRPYGGGSPAALLWWRDQNGGNYLPPPTNGAH